MATRISHIPFFERMIIPDWALFAAAVTYALPATALFVWKPIAGIAFAAAPLLVLLVAHGPSAIYVLTVATFLFMPLHGSITLLPPDMAAFLVIVAYLIDLFFRGRNPGNNRLLYPFLFYYGVVFLSVVFSGFTALSLRYFLRQSVLIGTFMAVAHFGPRLRIKNILVLFVLAANLNSLYSVMEFLGAGGTIRAFGLAGRGYGDHAMMAFTISLIYYLWTRDIRERIFWGGSALVMLAALAATQTRASAITAGWAAIVIVVLAVRYGRRIRCSIPRKSLALAIIIMLAVLPILVFYTPVFTGITDRFARIGLQASGTILLRMSLWKAALAAFWGHPILGIGAGNFPLVNNWVPDVRFDPIFYLVSGLSAHAVIFTSLAETGLIGFLSMFYFFGRAVRVSYQNLKSASNEADVAVTHCLFIAALVILCSSIYAGSWFWGNNSYHMAIMFGLAASFRHRREIPLPGGNAF